MPNWSSRKSRGELAFEPLGTEADLVLRVSGPCNYQLRQTLSEDGELAFRLDETTVDGAYSFELSSVPDLDIATRAVLLGARASGDESQVDVLCREGLLPPRPITQSGGFLVNEGRIVYDATVSEIQSAPQAASRPSKLDKDFSIFDDLIVNGSACIGFDCVDGESFGFDTLRLKDFNLRIGFDDTSSAAAFPNNDWELQANDIVNGGANKFSIEDVTHGSTPFTVEAAAPDHALFVDADGHIGGRTSTPAEDFHTISGNTPTLRLEQDGSGGLDPQTWDLAGNEANFYLRDVTGSRRPFIIESDAPSSSLFIDAVGRVGLGTSLPGRTVHISRTSPNGTKVRIENTNDPSSLTGFELANIRQEWSIHNSSNGHFILREIGGDIIMNIDPASNEVTFAGSIVTNGGGLCDPGPCDGTFVDYELESIEEHAEYMWRNQHLWGVGPTPEGEPIDLGRKVTGILHELEKAHIYIEQQNWELVRLAAENRLLTERVEAIEAREAQGAE